MNEQPLDTSSSDVQRAGVDRREHVIVLEIVQRMETKLDKFNNALQAHIAEETSDIAKEVASLMAAAFPEGDPDGHRRHHELVIAKEEARAAFWQKMLFEISRFGLIGLFGWFCLVAWKAFLLGPKQ